MNISAHITLSEAITSTTAIRKGINNVPDAIQVENMKQIADKVFEPLRTYIGMKRGKNTPIKITSFFRSVELNKAVGGSGSSQHCKGEAMDIQTNYPDFTNRDLFLAIRDKSTFDQLIWEFGTDQNPAWIHVSYKKEGNRKQVLKAISENGGTKYIPFL
ncbi:MAG: hypothetical protein A2Z57_11185 [Planctomycetes bacterium RIFCSPHIGHO2_12_39_6]|nr:MAG: hypothetical protein A2Z57_11185 [Planctomycetes bacterium RIFCSPHIGHO2_12_39_6]